jgi:hypothetical protein
MAKCYEVLEFLIPNGGWYQVGEEYEGIQFLECEPITKKQYTDGFAKYDAFKTKQDADKASAKSALLAKLGISEDEAKLLLG